jgi:hypothetical protein
VALVRKDVSEGIIYIIRFTRISEVGKTLAVTSLLDSFHLDDGGDVFIRNVGFYKSHP